MVSVENSQNEKSEAGSSPGDLGHKTEKMTYAQALKCRSNVELQNEQIRLGQHPTGEETNDNGLAH